MNSDPTADVTAVLEGLMPPSEYVAERGMRCPACRGTAADLDSGDDADLRWHGNTRVVAVLRCRTCGTRRREIYQLTTYEIVK